MNSILLRAALAVLLATRLAQGAPVTLAHSGYVLDAMDAAVDGPTPMTFAIFPTQGAAVPAWSSGTCTVAVAAGYYAVSLGGDCGTGLTTAALPVGATAWLEVAIGGTTLAPRVRLDALPAALEASHALDADRLGGELPAAFLATDGSRPLTADWNAGAGRTITAGTFVGSLTGTVTDGVVTTGSYADPAWLTSVAATKLTGTVADGALSGNVALLTRSVNAFTGSLAIGTTSAAGRLQIGGTVPDATARLVLGKVDAASEANLPVLQQKSVLAAGAGNDLALGATGASGGLLFYAGATDAGGALGSGSNAARLAILPNGNVGIGTTAPTASLDLGSRTDGIVLPRGTSAQRPGAAEVGSLRYNTTTGSVEVFSGSSWATVGSGAASFTGIGGTVTQVGGYTIHTFTSSGTFTPTSTGTVELLVVGGGGSGGGAGGGGGGGVVYVPRYAVGPQTYTVTVGNGGPGVSSAVPGNPGQSSAFGTVVAQGGGGGGNYNSGGGAVPGGAGGSGGGGGWSTGPSVPGAATQGESGGGTGYGNPGGWGNYNLGQYTSGGGGGAGGPGGNAFPNRSGDGGPGFLSSISGTARYYAAGGGGGSQISGRVSGNGGLGGGGGGGSWSSSSAGTGGTGGTTTGENGSNGYGGAGGANTGSGSGGMGISANSTGAGGSGIVIVRYAAPAAHFATGGTVTTAGGNVVHTFTQSGTFTPTGATNVKVLVVGGGGSGGGAAGGGGGGVVYSASYAVTAQPYSVAVGAGGAAGLGSVQGNPGANSSFGTLTALGGGGGGNYTSGAGAVPGGAGGSGGGGGYSPAGGSAAGGAATQPGSASGGAGFAGGTGNVGLGAYTSGGGGGAGAQGGNATSTQSGHGGAGVQNSITGTALYYGGGGGGGSQVSGHTSGNGGAGGGGGGGSWSSSGSGNGGTGGSATGDAGSVGAGGAGAPNTGGGGGGMGISVWSGGAGGSGVVIVSYPVSLDPT